MSEQMAPHDVRQMLAGKYAPATNGAHMDKKWMEKVMAQKSPEN